MIMPFGKFAGYELDELPNNYIAWLAGLENLRQPLKSAVEAERARREGRRTEDFPQHPDFRIGGDDRETARLIVQSGRRALAKTAHPDATNGSVVVMQKINRVTDILLEGLR